MPFSTLHTVPWKGAYETRALPQPHPDDGDGVISGRTQAKAKAARTAPTVKTASRRRRREAIERPHLDGWLPRFRQRQEHQFFKEKHGFSNRNKGNASWSPNLFGLRESSGIGGGHERSKCRSTSKNHFYMHKHLKIYKHILV